MGKLIEAQMSTETTTESLYADDAIDQIVSEFVSCEFTLGLNDLSATVQTAILGQSVDSNGIKWANSDDIAPYVAVGFRAKKPSGEYKYVYLVVVQRLPFVA
jgi:phi13 family phage major tail protein